MATPTEVHEVLHLLARELAPRKGWAIDESPAWTSAFAQTDPEQLRRAAGKWFARGTDKVPKLAEFRRMVASVRPATEAKACGLCVEGWREVMRHVRKDGRTSTELRAARCTCSAGDSHPASVPDWRTQEMVWRNAEATARVIVDPTAEDRHGGPLPEGSSDVLVMLREMYGVDLPPEATTRERPRYAEEGERW